MMKNEKRTPKSRNGQKGACTRELPTKARSLSSGVNVDMVELMDRCLDDVAMYLPEVDVYKAKYRLRAFPEYFRDFVNGRTLEAETCLAQGGFEAYAAWRQVQSLIKKNSDWFACSPKEREDKAIAKFLAAEEACGETNLRLKAARKTPNAYGVAVKVLNLAKTKVRDVLGVLSESIYLDCLQNADYGPGSPYLADCRWEDSRSIYYKMSGDQTVTRNALTHMRLALELNDGWKELLLKLDAHYQIVDEGKVASVEKNAEVNRVIEGQPSMNVYLQKGAGNVMAKLIRRIGIDLSTQARNHRAARKGSLNGKTATVDMTSASDLNACALVEWLFPPDWYQFLDDLTVRWGLMPDGRVIRHEMFSSMGNATTFAIECLVFYSIAWASAKIAGEDTRSIRVYGDDLIVPVGSLGLVFETLRFAGHVPNVEKTHVWGPFRESCGRDYVHGVDVRPVYLDHVPTTDMEVMSLYNRLTLMAMMPLSRTTEYLRNLARDLRGPPDLGASVDSAMDALIGSQERSRSGRPTGSAQTRVLALAIDSYYVVDPPPPSGYCSSYQSQYWTFRGYTSRAVPLDGADDDDVKWCAVLYGARLLGSAEKVVTGSDEPVRRLSHRGPLQLDKLKVPSQQSKTFVPEKYVFRWSSVDLVRTSLWAWRLK